MNKPVRHSTAFLIGGILFLACLVSYQGHVFAEENPSEIFAGKIIKTEGGVDVLPSGQGKWVKAFSRMMLRPGDIIKTRESGWAALMMADESIIQINRNSYFQLKKVTPRANWLKIDNQPFGLEKPAGSDYFLKKGHIWLRNKNKNQHIEIKTPYVSMSIKGTELDIRTKPRDRTTVRVLEGRVNAMGPEGSLFINELEQAVAGPGIPLGKQLITNPKNAVQWTISLQPMIQMAFNQKLFKDNPELVSGWRHLESGRYVEAIDLFDKKRLSGPLAGLGMGIGYALQRDYGASKSIINRLKRTRPDYGPIHVLDALLSLVAGHDAQAAFQSIEKAIELLPRESYPVMVKSLVHQSVFDLDLAMSAIREALVLDKENHDTLLNLAKLKFAKGYPDHSLDIVQKVLKAKPDHSQALNLKGFLLLAMLDTNRAKEAFESAINANPYLGESYLGLALAHMRYGDQKQAFKQITTAVLMEPQRSVFLSYWAKMLYEVRRFDQALDMLALAQRLDPNDPTPYYYQALIYKDLNRHHEAIFTLQKAVALNDNMAVYRSRFLLDKDLAVKNIKLAQLYRDLGVTDWGTVKAITSMKLDNNSFAAHNFVADRYDHLHGETSIAARSSRLKAFLLAPANVNTLSNSDDYTLFFEQPDISGTVSSSVGSQGFWEISAETNAAVPSANIAFQVDAKKYQKDGFKDYDWEDYEEIDAAVKWDISYKDTLSIKTCFSHETTGDLSAQRTYSSFPDPVNRTRARLGYLSGGYVHHFSPDATLMVYVKREDPSKRYAATHDMGSGTALMTPYAFDYLYDYTLKEWLVDPYIAIQASQFYKIKDHQFNVGMLFYESDRNYRNMETTDTSYYWTGTDILASEENSSTAVVSSKARRQQFYYIQDIWNPFNSLTLEAALYLDRLDNVNSWENLTWTNTSFNPRFGLIYRLTKNDTFHLSWAKYREPFDRVERIDAIEVAGHVFANFYEGTIYEDIIMSYEHEWSTGMFLTRIAKREPTFDYLTYENDVAVQKRWDNQYMLVETSFNQLLFSDMGLSAGHVFFDVRRDKVTPHYESHNHWIWARLTKVHESGLSASVSASYFDVDYDTAGRKDNGFWTASSFVEYEFPKKRGKIRFEINNIFEEHFDSSPLAELTIALPYRTYGVRVEFNF